MKENEKPAERDSKQRTLFDLQKVVRLDRSVGEGIMCFSSEGVLELKKALLDPASPKWLLLQTLRKLDCFKLEFADLVDTQLCIGSAVATLTAHPKVEVARLAHSLASKWHAVIDQVLFKQLPYDAELAASVPEDPPAPPPPPPGQDATQQAAERQEQRRQQEMEFMLSESEGEGSSDGGSDDDWQPGSRRRRASGKRKQKG